jgi:hypothetical protein
MKSSTLITIIILTHLSIRKLLLLLLILTVVLDFMEDSSNHMQQPNHLISTHSPLTSFRIEPIKNLRAENGQSKSRKRQSAKRIIPIIRILPRIRRRAKAVQTACRPRQYSHGNKAADEQEIEQDEQPAQELWRAALEAQVEQETDDGVCDGGGENAFDCAGGPAQLAGEAVDFVEARGEETEGAGRGG